MKDAASFISPDRSSLLAVAGKLTEIHYRRVTFPRHLALLVLIAVLGGACPSLSIISNAVTKSNSTQTVASTAPVPELDPEAVATLDKMGAYMRTVKTYQVRATTTTEDVLDDGQKIQYDATTDLLVQMPDKMRVEHPQFTAAYTWNLAPSFNEAALTFDPPKDAHRITIAVANAAAEKKE